MVPKNACPLTKDKSMYGYSNCTAAITKEGSHSGISKENDLEFQCEIEEQIEN